MAGVPPIPPLVCNTPPPIDFGDDEDDSGLPPTLTLDDDDDFGDFALAIEITDDSTNADVSSLPRTPLQYELSSSTTSGFTDVPPVLEEYVKPSPAPPPAMEIPGREENSVNNNTLTQPNEAYNYNVVRNLESNVPKSTTDRVTQVNTDLVYTIGATIATTSNAEAFSNHTNTKQTNSSANDNNINVETAPLDLDEATNSPASTDISCANDVKHDSDNDTQVSVDEAVTQDASRNDFITHKQSAQSAILLEDLADDSSDDECHRSPKKIAMESANINEDSEDFFAIHMVEQEAAADPTIEEISTKTEDFEEINSNSYANINSDNTADANSFDSVDFNDAANFNADFSQFADFKSHSPVTETIPTAETKTNDNYEDAKDEINNEVDGNNYDDNDDDDFDDFQDFATATINITPPVTVVTANPPALDKHTQDGSEKSEVNAVEGCADDDDDDDFGDFEEASFAPPVTNASTNDNEPQIQTVTQDNTTTQSPITSDTSNLQERLNSLLKMMFPTSKQTHADDVEELNTKQQSSGDALPLESVEAAKALEFQWPNSEMRHALIRAIGIDSRNILFGENWNPAMPRFAANLSFNPLKPMKPQSACSSSGNTMSGGIEIEAATGNMENMTYITKSDVPEVEFDWQSAGLVNPLEGLKGEANTRETETIYTPSPGQSDASDDKHQSCTTYANINDQFSETLSNENDVTSTNTSTVNITTSAIANVSAKDQQCTPHMTLPLDSAFTLAPEHDCKVLESNAKRTLTPLHFGVSIDELEDETVATSTYAGPLKETHIYTPSKSELAAAKSKTASCSEPIDFDYEIAAAGIIIDETVVKKEYRDVEYNPGFSLEPSNIYAEQVAASVSAIGNQSSAISVTFPCVTIEPIDMPKAVTPTPTAQHGTNYDYDEFTEFTEFQSVPPPLAPLATLNSSINATSVSAKALPTAFNTESTSLTTATVSVSAPVPLAVTKAKEQSRNSSRTSSPTIIDNMILSPAILLPQAIPISANSTASTPTIEWGNSAATINPEELARIEELFPQPKKSAINDARKDNSQKSSPAHVQNVQSGDGKRVEMQEHNSLSISATVAQKEQDSSLNDDYWSDFVSVTVPQADANNIKNNNNNNHLVQTPKRQAAMNAANANANISVNANTHSQANASPLQHNKNYAAIRTAAAQHRAHAMAESSSNNCNDDDWSDFVSSTPAPTHAHAAGVPATAYNYMNAARSHAMTPQFNSAAWQNANFYNNPIGLYHQTQHHAATTAPQQIHIMQDFSTMPASRPQIANHNARNNMSAIQHVHSNHALQVGSARVAPSVSLIPDLGFVAPAMPVHTAFINVLPKPSYNGKK